MFQRKKKKSSHGSDFFLGNWEEERVNRREEPAPVKQAPPRRRAVRTLGGETPAPKAAEAPVPKAAEAPAPKAAEVPAPKAAEAPVQPEKPAVDIFEGLEDGLKKERISPRRAIRQIPAKKGEPTPEAEQAPDLPFGATAFVRAFEEVSAAPKPKKPRRARRVPKKEQEQAADAPHRAGKLAEYLGGEDQKKLPSDPAQAGVAAELQEMYGTTGKGKKRRALTGMDYVRYAVLFLCLFGFFTAGYFVVDKLYDYVRGSALYRGLADMVTTKDRFADDYLIRSLPQDRALTIEDVYNGKHTTTLSGVSANAEQQSLIAKINRLKEINPDTVGWISIENTVVNYPLVWSKTRNYYLHRDFYGKTLSGGSIFLDERNSPNIAENRNTVIYGHNMADGSMFASLHDFENASVFANATIQIATSDAIYVYKPFSVHQSDAYDNYFETDFPTDKAYESFLAEMQLISIYGADLELDRNSQIITLSTCVSNTVSNNERFAVHAVLVEVIR